MSFNFTLKSGFSCGKMSIVEMSDQNVGDATIFWGVYTDRCF